MKRNVVILHPNIPLKKKQEKWKKQLKSILIISSDILPDVAKLEMNVVPQVHNYVPQKFNQITGICKLKFT